ncbi:hypothetical protein NQ910_18530 [Acinetobacter baumannii]|nr:hypothetical protein [Acinetobacter baumannii]
MIIAVSLQNNLKGKEQLDKIFTNQKIILRDEGIAFAPTQSFLVVQIPVERLNEETYQRNIVPRIRENGWILEKHIKIQMFFVMVRNIS